MQILILHLFCSAVLTVSFEQPSYSVTESAGQVEACVVLNCEAAQPVTVSVSANSAEAMGNTS